MTEQEGNRRFQRWQVDIPIFIEAEDQTHYCTFYDISPGGALVRPLHGDVMPIGKKVSVDLEFFGHIEAEVRHVTKGVVGLQFLHDESRQDALSAWLMDTRPGRRPVRYSCDIPARIVVDGHKLDCKVTNLSRSGACITSARADRLMVTSEVVLELPGYGTMAALVRHVVDDNIGLSLIDGYDGVLPPDGADDQA